MPIFNLDDEYILCLTSNNEAVIDVPPILDTGLSDADYAFEWRLDGVVLTTETSPSLIPTQGGTYEVTVTDTSTSTVTMCQNFDSTEVIESGIPDRLISGMTNLTVPSPRHGGGAAGTPGRPAPPGIQISTSGIPNALSGISTGASGNMYESGISGISDDILDSNQLLKKYRMALLRLMFLASSSFVSMAQWYKQSAFLPSDTP